MTISAKYKNLNYNKTRLANVENWSIVGRYQNRPTYCQNALKFSPELWDFSPKVQKEQENKLKISFCFQTGDKIVIYVSTRGHWDCTTLQHHCTAFWLYRGASGWYNLNARGFWLYSGVKGGTISMPKGRHIDNW